MTAERGERRGVRAMRRYYPAYLTRVPDAARLVEELKRADSLAARLEVLEEAACGAESMELKPAPVAALSRREPRQHSRLDGFSQ